jgi:hypothetical protein
VKWIENEEEEDRMRRRGETVEFVQEVSLGRQNEAS